MSDYPRSKQRETVSSCDGNKSPGPDGFNLNFWKACWSFVKEDVLAFFNEFHSNAHCPKALTASFLTLIPKKDHPQDLFDYRPICLIGSLYKILSKLLANRLKKVLGKLISNCQSAYLLKRQILDGIVVLNEIIDFAKRRKDECLLFKVDFERAYDTMINIGFWNVKWFGNQPFSELFPSLYVTETCRNALIADRLGNLEENSVISWQWTELLSESEEQQAVEIAELLIGFSLQPGNTAHWRWIPDTNKMYFVKSCYNILLSTRQLAGLEPNVLNAINQQWRNDTPSKVLVFCWRLSLERLPNQTSLHRRVSDVMTRVRTPVTRFREILSELFMIQLE
ncbi:hypothetical protein TSUD_146380 [Trifolium subterraneum]|uniref:Reverse transcriptase domain-containing protein n=1 Tax=Trifolium subterraneum TaxID=3900 RepID=A0A2Z6N6L6_TRISU|nr:hypothetical protein TSUD_146380 [Trifolium subterraneum]